MKDKIFIADDHWFRENINCQYACPVNTPAMNYIERAVEGDFNSSLRLNFMANLLPHVLGRVCTHPCETACRRGAIDTPISICAIKRSVADFASQKFPPKPADIEKTGKRIAIIGSGPSGLAAAHDLAIYGHTVVIYEALPVAGGMLSVGIPPYRLPREKIEDTVTWIKNLDVELHLNTAIDSPKAFNGLLRANDAVYIAAGAHKSQLLEIPGEELPGVLHGVAFMRDTNLGTLTAVPEKVVVVGGGFTAIDCARSSLRLGAREVSIVYRRTLEEMPAGEIEVRMAEEEGIKMHYLTSPIRILAGRDQKVAQIECLKNTLGEPDDKGRRRPIPTNGSNFTIPADMIIAAIGQSPGLPFLSHTLGVEVTRRGMPLVSQENFMTTRPGVFAGGDCITGPRNVIEVIADGRKAARSIHAFLTGQERTGYRFFYKEQAPSGRAMDYEAIPKQRADGYATKEKLCLNAEAEPGLSRETALKEASRCLLCHYNIFIDETCILCGGCIDVCPNNCISMASREQIDVANAANGDAIASGDWDAAMVINEEKCIRCGLCVKRCPVGAITMKRFSYTVD